MGALSIEVGVGVGALIAAGSLYDGTSFGVSLALWGFWLVHSGRALLGARRFADAKVRVDPFEAAMQRAQRLLDEL